jgi:hypothetical protein
MTSNRGSFDRTPIRPDRVPRIDGSFAAISHRFLRDGFWASLEHHELLLYFLLALVADRQGMSFYHDDRLAAILRLVLDDFLAARAALVRKDLIAYDPTGHRHQVLSLPAPPTIASQARNDEPPPRRDQPPEHVREAIRDLLARTDPHRR